MEHHYAHINGIKLHYVAQGEGPVILFVHGFPEFWYGWSEQLDALSKSYRVVAVDMRGYNLSDKPAAVEAYRSTPIVEDLRQLIDHLGGPVRVVAHDWGGAMVWDFAIRHPQYLTQLVIINAPHPVVLLRELRNNPAQRAALDYFLLFRSDKAERVLSDANYARLQRMFDSWDVGGHPVTPEKRQAYIEAWSQPGALTGSLNWYRATRLSPPAPGESNVDSFELDADRHVVRVPTMVIWGEQDIALLPCLLDGLEQVVPDLRVERLPHGSHWVHHEYPEQVNALLEDFFADAG